MNMISVIIPVYNSGKYLERCLNSVLNQTYEDLEVILIDDGSTDNSKDIYEEYSKDNRLKTIRIENSGSAYARNLGLSIANGSYIAFLDSDDFIDSDMYENLLKVAESKNIDIVSCNYDIVDTNRIYANNLDYREGLYQRKELINEIFPSLICSELLEIKAPFTMVTKLFRRELIMSNKIEFNPNLRAGQDFVFSVSAMISAKSFYLIDKAYYHYYRNFSSRTNTPLTNSGEVFFEANRSLEITARRCKDFDFTSQLILDKLRGTISAIWYQFKGKNSMSYRKLYKKVKEIVKLMEPENSFSIIDIKKLGFERKIIVIAIKFKLYSLIVLLGILKKRLGN